MKRLHFTINRECGISLTDQLIDGIRKSIESGFFSPGDTLPGFREIAGENSWGQSPSHIIFPSVYTASPEMALSAEFHLHKPTPNRIFPCIRRCARLGIDHQTVTARC